MGRIITALGVLLFLSACRADRRAGGQADSARHAANSARAPTSSDGRRIALFLGTSLTAGLGVDPDSAYPAIVARRADSLGLGWRVINGGLSGETSAGALRRLEWLLAGAVKLLVVETGANDGLRGLDPDSTRANIAAIVRRARAYDSTMTIVIAGMEAPPNLGRGYTARFRAVFPELARREHLPLIPFLLAGVAGVDTLNQSDGIHPTPAGHRIVADNVWRVIARLMPRRS